jgi:predicted permease
MDTLATVILPVFGLLAFGYAATFTPVFEAGSARVLANFVYWFVIPILLFRLLATVTMPESIPWATLLAYIGGITLSFALGTAAAYLLGRFTLAEAGITGFSTAFGNTFLLGTPLVLTSFGDEAALPFFLIMTLDSIWLFMLVTIVCEIGLGHGQALRSLPWTIVKRLGTNPILIGLAAGLAFHRSGLTMPVGIDRWTELIGQAAIPCALFATGAALRDYRLGGALVPITFMTVMKLVLQPIVVWVLARHVFGVPLLWASVAAFTAAMPTGVNAYIFAVRYEAGQREAAAAILVSTVLALFTLWLALLLLET